MQNSKSGRKKLGAVIYLRNLAPLAVASFVSDFHKRWPDVALVGEGQEGNCSFFRAGHSHIAVDVRLAPVPEPVTDSAITKTRHWSTAKKELAPHQSHMAVATEVDDDALARASELTKAVSSLLAVSDSMGICWLNGPVLNPAKDFVAIAAEMFALNQLPLMLWIAAQWEPEGQLVHTKGMSQFGAPELFLAQQPGPSMEIVTYLFDLVRYVLTSGNSLLDGETIDGPSGVFRIESLQGNQSGKMNLFLVPVRPN